MPENSPTIGPSDVRMVRELTKKTADLAFLTVEFVNGGRFEDAQDTARICAEGLAILQGFFQKVSPTDAASIAGEVRRQNQADAEARIQ